MTIEQLEAMIAESNILTPAEKNYWSGNLPNMNPVQLKKLETILVKAAKIPWNEQVQKYFALIAKSAAAVTARA